MSRAELPEKRNDRDAEEKGRFARLMTLPVPFWALALTVQMMMVAFIAFGSIIVDTLIGSRRLGTFGDAVTEVASIPQTLKRSRIPEARMDAPAPREALPDGLWINPQGGVRDDGFLLVSRYRAEQARFVVELLDLASGKVLKSWAPDILDIHARSKVQSKFVNLKRDQGPQLFVMIHPLLTQDGGLITHYHSPLVKIDRCSRIEWMIDGIFHHATETDRDGNYWVPYSYAKSLLPNASPDFQDQALAHVSPDGKVLKLIRLEKIIRDNDLGRLIDVYPYHDDPYHLNDIQPALTDGAFWKADDLFLSLRHLSTVMLYRPSTGKVLWWRQGNVVKQHDIQILDRNRIAIFDNDLRNTYSSEVVSKHNREAIYDFTKDSFSYPFDAAFAAQKIATVTQGRGLIMENGDVVVEETEYGRILRIAPDGTVRWRYISVKPDGTRTQLGWSRYLERSHWMDAVQNAVKGSCP